jgi:hypothetical protein
MGSLTNTACSSGLTPFVQGHGLGLVFFGLALAAFGFLGGFGWLRRGFLRVRAWTYGAIQPSTHPLSAGDYWLISVVLLVAALTWSVTTSGAHAAWAGAAAGAPIGFFVYATLGLAVVVRLYIVIYAVEKKLLVRPPRRTADRLLARISTERTVSPAYAEPAERVRRASVASGVGMVLLAPIVYLWQTVVAILSVVIWALYSPLLLLALTPARLVGLAGVAIAVAGVWLPRACG